MADQGQEPKFYVDPRVDALTWRLVELLNDLSEADQQRAMAEIATVMASDGLILDEAIPRRDDPANFAMDILYDNLLMLDFLNLKPRPVKADELSSWESLLSAISR